MKSSLPHKDGVWRVENDNTSSYLADVGRPCTVRARRVSRAGVGGRLEDDVPPGLQEVRAGWVLQRHVQLQQVGPSLRRLRRRNAFSTQSVGLSGPYTPSRCPAL